MSPMRFSRASSLLQVGVLEALDRYGASRPSWPRLSFESWATLLAAIGAVHQAAFGLATVARFTCCASQSTGTAIYPDLDLFGREVLRQLDPYVRTRCAGQAIATIVTVGPVPGRAPCATGVLTVGAIQPGITLGTGAATGIHRQFFSHQGIDAQGQVTPGLGWFFMGTRCPTGGELAAVVQLGMPHLQL